jgi:hypothetical protein
MPKKKRANVKELVTTIKRDLDPSQRFALIHRLLVEIPQEEFSCLVGDMLGSELLPRFQNAGFTLVSNDDWRFTYELANECCTLKQKLSRLGRRQTAEGWDLKNFVWACRRDGRTEGQILIKVNGRPPYKKVSKPYIKKIILEGDRLGLTRPFHFQLPSVEAMRRGR